MLWIYRVGSFLTAVHHYHHLHAVVNKGFVCGVHTLRNPQISINCRHNTMSLQCTQCTAQAPHFTSHSLLPASNKVAASLSLSMCFISLQDTTYATLSFNLLLDKNTGEKEGVYEALRELNQHCKKPGQG